MLLSRTPRLLWRSLTMEVLGVLLIALLGLVGVIAFAAAMRPLAEGRVGPFEAVRLMGLLAVPMLQFAMPFAAGLAATLAYHRFAAENEATACMAGGISHRSLLMPALALGVVLSLLLAVLSHEVIPRFLRSAERLLTRDVTRFIVNPIERGETVQVGSWEIRADQVINAAAAREGEPDRADGGAVEHLVLLGVLAHRVNSPEEFIEAARVDLWLFEDELGAPGDGGAERPDDEGEGGTRAVLRFDRANAFVGDNRLEGRGVYTDSLRIPSAFRDDPKFLDFSELRRVRDTPEMLNRIDWRRRLVAKHLALRDMAEDVRKQLETGGKAVLTRGGAGQGSGGDVVTIYATGLESGASGDTSGWVLTPPRDEPGVRVEVELSNGARRTHTAERARLRFREPASDQAELAASESADGTAGAGVWLRLELEGVTTSDRNDRAAQVRSDSQQYASLRTSTDHGAVRLGQGTFELIEAASVLTRAGAGEGPGMDSFRRATNELRTKTDDLRREATSKLHERAAFSVSCFIMVLCGAVVALRLASALPLQVYLWSFLPALGCVITISAGQGLAHKSGSSGLVLLWGGVAALGVVTWAMYASLRRH
ncbi:MAG: LptF/LptG family permease [Phycisphaerales bacterium]